MFSLKLFSKVLWGAKKFILYKNMPINSKELPKKQKYSGFQSTCSLTLKFVIFILSKYYQLNGQNFQYILNANFSSYQEYHIGTKIKCIVFNYTF